MSCKRESAENVGVTPENEEMHPNSEARLSFLGGRLSKTESVVEPVRDG